MMNVMMAGQERFNMCFVSEAGDSVWQDLAWMNYLMIQDPEHLDLSLL